METPTAATAGEHVSVDGAASVVRDWLQEVAGLAGAKLAHAVQVCDDELLESVSDLRRLHAANQLNGLQGLTDAGFKRGVAVLIHEAFVAEAAAAPEPAAATADGGDGPEARLLNQDAASEDVTSPMDGFELVPLQTLAQCVAATPKTKRR